MPAATKRRPRRDRKSTRLNSSLHSFPTRRSSDLLASFRKMVCTAAATTLLLTFPVSAGDDAGSNETPAEKRSEEHTSELQSPLFPYTTLFRSARFLQEDGLYGSCDDALADVSR